MFELKKKKVTTSNAGEIAENLDHSYISSGALTWDRDRNSEQKSGNSFKN